MRLPHPDFIRARNDRIFFGLFLMMFFPKSEIPFTALADSNFHKLKTSIYGTILYGGANKEEL